MMIIDSMKNGWALVVLTKKSGKEEEAAAAAAARVAEEIINGSMATLFRLQ